jgi:predicted nuclease of restriction endonuclease-like (RecB) superfamily
MNFEQLIQTIKQTHEHLQNKAISAVNQTLTIRNWLFGLYIVEYEQDGEDRAKYGKKILKSISEKLSRRDVSGISERNMRNYRQFYIAYPQIITVISESFLPESIWQLLTAKSEIKSIKPTTQHHFGVAPELLINRLSFTHIVELSRESDTLKRTFYESQAISGNWSVEELKRQMGSLLYERTGLSKNKEKLLKLTKHESTQLVPSDIIRDPYIFEFVGLKQHEVVLEKHLEKALLDHIQKFLIELGRGFCFEARQKRITVDDEHFYIDLVFYHRILKCHIIIDLKTRKFSHSDASQLNFYLNYYKDNEMSDNDNLPVGILLCTDKGEATVKYATAGINNQLFVSRYKTVLPSEEELRAEIEKEKRLLGQ